MPTSDKPDSPTICPSPTESESQTRLEIANSAAADGPESIASGCGKGFPHQRSESVGRPLAIGILALLLIAKACLAVIFYDPSRVWLHQDDYCRALMSYDWGCSPYLWPADLHWLPLPFYLYGLASRIGHTNYQLVFVVVSQILSAGTLLAVYGLGRVFFSRRAALCGAALYAFAAWQTVMSFSALAEPVYYFLVCWGICLFARWWTRGGAASIALALGLLALATLTRYEAWLMLAIVDGLIVIRWWRRGSPRGLALVAILGLPWVLAGVWIVANLCAYREPLAFYGANREAFRSALYELTPVQRCLRYPVAFLSLSLPLTGVMVLTGLLVLTGISATARSLLKPAAVIAGLVFAHLAAMVVLYVTGSGPSFVERIVLVHLFLLMPLAGAVLDAGWSSQRRLVQVLAAAFLLAFAVSEPWRTGTILSSGYRSDYPTTADAYYAIGGYLSEHLPSTAGDAAVQCHDNGYCVRIVSGLPQRVCGVSTDNIATVLAQRRVRMLCIPAQDGDWLKVEPNIEDAFRAAHPGHEFIESRVGVWRVLRAQ